MKSSCISIASFLFLAFVPLRAAEFFVSPDGRKDAVGSRDNPFASLEDARDFVRNQQRSGSLRESVTITMLSGRYFFRNAFELTEEDSGTESSPILYRAEQRRKTFFFGGIEIDPGRLKKINDPNILKRLHPSVRDKVLCVDLNEYDVTDFKEWTEQFRTKPNAPPELFFNGRPMPIARYPNEGWAEFETALDRGWAHSEEEIERNKKTQEKWGGRFEHPDVDVTKNHGGTFLYEDSENRPARWNVENGVWLFGYWSHDWASDTLKVARIDPENKTITFAAPHEFAIGHGTWGGHNKRRYYALNILEELDAPGEWYLDRKEKILYFYPPENVEWTKSPIVLSLLEDPMVRMRDVSYVRFQGLDLSCSYGNGIEILGGTKNMILDCSVSNIGGDGVIFRGGEWNLIRGCDVFQIGSTGIRLDGGDRHKLIPSNHHAINNDIYRFGRLARTYNGAFSVVGVGQVVRNNRMHEGPHLAVDYGGNDHLFERNEIFRVALETGDVGAFYSGRDWTSQGNIVRENFFHDLGSPDSHAVMGVYLDDCDSGDLIERNIFYKAGRAIFFGGGRDNIARENIVIDSFHGIHLDSRGKEQIKWGKGSSRDGWDLEEKAKHWNYLESPWKDRYPKLAATMQNNPTFPLGTRIENNLFVDCVRWANIDDFTLNMMTKDYSDNVLVQENTIVQNKIASEADKLPTVAADQQHYMKEIDGSWKQEIILEIKSKHALSAFPISVKRVPDIPIEKIGLQNDKYRQNVSLEEIVSH